MPIVVCNSSPLINLAIIGRLYLLNKFWDKIFIPEAVWQEVIIDGAGNPEVEDIKNLDWIVVMKVKNRNLVSALAVGLDKGEAESIALAIELNADTLIIDESDGRNAADTFSIKKTGVLGILIKAKLQKMIPNLKEEIHRLQTDGGFWLNETLIEKVLKGVNEL